MALEEITLTLDGRTLGLFHAEGRPPALLFFHGAGNGARHLAPLAEALSGREVFLLDAPGRGASEGPPLERVRALAQLGAAAMRALGRDEWIACGHSLGGAVALECGFLPEVERPLALVLLATGARLRVSPAILELVRGAADRGEAAPTVELAFVESNPDELARVHALDANIPPGAALADWVAADSFDRMDDLAEVTSPCLVLTGTADPLTPEKYARYLAERLVGATLVRLEGAGHMFPLERPEETARAIAAFVARFSRGGA